jgi:hypothetical protein
MHENKTSWRSVSLASTEIRPYCLVYKNFMTKAWPKCCFSLCIRNMQWHSTTILEWAEEHRKNISQKWNLQIDPAFYNKLIIYKNLLILSRTFRGYMIDHLLFSYHGIRASHSQTDITNHIVKLTVLFCNTPLTGMNFVTVTNVTKRPNKW